MTNDRAAQDAHLDCILSLWHWWAQTEKQSRGHNHKALVVGECRGYGLQYESQVEQQDADSEALQSKRVDTEVRGLEDPWKAAIYVLARNLYTGRDVWLSPRLPSSKPERDAIIAQARQRLTLRLMNAGVM